MNLPVDHKGLVDSTAWEKLFERLRKEPLLVLAAHPDDETIGASWLLSQCFQSSVVFLTDGAPRDTSLWPAIMNGSREEYARMRREEASRALDHAAIPDRNLFWIGAVDQDAVLEIARLIQDFANLCAKARPGVIVTHAYEGGHPDHDTAALVASAAIPRFSQTEQPLLLEMTSYHARDGQCVTGEFLPRDATEFVLPLSDEDRDRKRKMMNAYASQRLVLGNFAIDIERLRFAPSYDFSRPPHEGKLWYECMGWPMTGSRWRELAAAAIPTLQEHLCH